MTTVRHHPLCPDLEMKLAVPSGHQVRIGLISSSDKMSVGGDYLVAWCGAEVLFRPPKVGLEVEASGGIDSLYEQAVGPATPSEIK
jgi:hypothetical protein